MIMFRRNLKYNVKIEFMRNGTIIKKFEKLIKQTIEVDDKLYERIMKKRHDGKGFDNHKYSYKIQNSTATKQQRNHLTNTDRYRWKSIS